MDSKQKKRWHNWSSSVRCTPQQIVKPGSIAELAHMVKMWGQQGRHVRVVGSGHSFTPLVESDDVLVSLENVQGIESFDEAHNTVTALGGTQLKTLGKALFAKGLAQENLGDIDVQSIAGAISTGTHGTGIRFGTLSTQIEKLTLITADGELLECSKEQNPEVFKAARVSLGTLGIIAKATVRTVPAKRLHFQSHRESLDDCLTNLERYKQENSHFEFFWMPYTKWVQAKFLNETGEPASESNWWGTFNKIVMENYVYSALSESCRLMPRLTKAVSNISAMGIAPVDEIDYSHRLFATPRMVRFQEMEYNIPVEHFENVIREIRDCIEQHQFAVHFPIECRFVHTDDIWLSPAYQRDSAYIAVHMYKGMPYRSYFYHIEQIFRRYRGRPHWGKMHTQTAESLASLYPRWNDFRRVRAELDPDGMFLNSYLRSLFDVEVPVPSAKK